MDERLELCHKALKCKHNRLKGVVSDVAPILWQHGALARLDKGETIDDLLYHGYSTISMGIAGLYEMVYYMKGESHTTEIGREFGLKVLQYINDQCKKWKAEEDIDYSVYGTPRISMGGVMETSQQMNSVKRSTKIMNMVVRDSKSQWDKGIP